MQQTGDAPHFDSEKSRLFLIDLHRMKFNKPTYYAWLKAILNGLISKVRVRPPLMARRRWRIKDVAGLYYSSDNLGLGTGHLCRFMMTYSGISQRDAIKILIKMREFRADKAQEISPFWWSIQHLHEFWNTEFRFWWRVQRRATKLKQSDKKRRDRSIATVETVKIPATHPQL